MRNIPIRPSQRALTCLLALLLSTATSCSPSGSDGTPDGIVAQSTAPTFTLPISLNHEMIQPRALALNSDGFTEPLLHAFPIANAEPWAFAQVDTLKGSQLRLTLLHYPNADLVLHRDAKTHLIRVGLMSRKTHAFIPGFVANSPTQIKLYTQTALTSKSKADSGSAPKTPLRILIGTGAGTGNPAAGTLLEVTAKELDKLPMYGTPNKSKKKWWRLVDVLRSANASLPAGSTLIVMHQGKSNEPLELQMPAYTLEKHPETTLLKFNRRGQWKLWYLANNRSTTIAFSEIKIIDAP